MTLFKILKTLVIAVFSTVILWTSPAHAQGTLPIALVQQIDVNGQPLAGCLTYFFVAGTVATPQNAYQDFGLTQPLPNPLTCDQTGRVPMFWLANGLVHVRLTDSSGVQILDTTMQVLGPSSGGGGGGTTVDPTTILATGDEKVIYGTGPLTGFVRENGLAIGNAVSGATERANADTQALFVYLYGTDPNLVVSGGRTGNALADFNANKTIALPDMRGKANIALADMGNTATSLLTATYFGASVTTLGAIGVGIPLILGQPELPNVAQALNGTSGTVTVSGAGIGTNINGDISTGGSVIDGIQSNGSPGSASGSFTPQGTVNLNGDVAQTSINTVSPLYLITIYIKL